MHNREIAVPDLTGMDPGELDKFEEEGLFRFEVVDSIYDSDIDKGKISRQDPKPHTYVKKGRRIYLTTVAILPERVMMPDLRFSSLRQGIAMLETYGFLVDSIEFIHHRDKNAILGQKLNGVDVPPDTLIEKGSQIVLVVGKGLGYEKVGIPFLLGLKQKEATRILNRLSLNVGVEIFMDSIRDTSLIRVYKQKPEFGTDDFLYLGESVDLWYRSTELVDFKEYIRSLQIDSVLLDSLMMQNRIIDTISTDSLHDMTGFNDSLQ